jgi:Ca2+-binding RTX toxin-like protein
MQKRKTFHSNATTSCAAVEHLEQRRMLAAHPVGSAAVDTAGALVINGTNKRDVITVAPNATDAAKLDVTINGSTTTFNLVDILAGIRCSGGKGHDDIRLDAGVTLDSVLSGGAGNDILVGGSGADDLDGDNGNDSIDGGDGNDDCEGGNGKDHLSGGAGDDDLHGGKGADDLDGEDGDDNLSGEGGNDDCNGGAGADAFDDEDEVEDMENEDDLLVEYADLPAEVRASFEALFAGATADEIEADDEDGVLVYEIEFTGSDGVENDVELDASGQVLL